MRLTVRTANTIHNKYNIHWHLPSRARWCATNSWLHISIYLNNWMKWNKAICNGENTTNGTGSDRWCYNLYHGWHALDAFPSVNLHPSSLHWQANHQATWMCSREINAHDDHKSYKHCDKPLKHRRTNKSGSGWSTGSGLIKPSICTHSGYLYPFPNNPLW